MKALKAFIKLFEAPYRGVKIKFNLFFSLRPGLGREGIYKWRFIAIDVLPHWGITPRAENLRNSKAFIKIQNPCGGVKTSFEISWKEFVNISAEDDSIRILDDSVWLQLTYF